MDAMLLAAGHGTRLRPLTDNTPKALIEVGGVPMLERVARRVIDAGADRLIINVHYLGEQIEDFVRERNGFGVEVHISREPDRALETGGALVHADPLLRRDAPFFLHNADILTDAPLAKMYRRHEREQALATLAVMQRPTARRLLFDEQGLLGRVDEGKDLRLECRDPEGDVAEFAFAGIHVISPALLGCMHERGAFSILQPYLRLAAEGARIAPFRMDGSRWLDIGKPEQLEEAQRWDEDAAVGQLA